MAKKSEFKKGQFYAAKHKGNNGDLIVGEVKSVRKNGDVILTNLLTGNRSVKGADILKSRNKRISKAQAYALQAEYAKTGDRQKVRAMAVALPAYDEAQQEISFEPSKSLIGHYDITMRVYVRTAPEGKLPDQRTVENTISSLLLGLPRLDSGAFWDVSGTSLPAQTNWGNDCIQFARLLNEIVANLDGNQTKVLIRDLGTSMNLTPDQVNELFDRAEGAWEKAKES